MKNFPIRLKALRTEKDISQEELGLIMNLSKSTISLYESGKGFGFFGFGPGRGHGAGGPGGNSDAMAGILGITADELKAQLESGKKLEDIVTAQGMTMDQFQQKMEELRKEEISKAVADGKITQEQADKMSQHMGPRPHNNDNQAPAETDN